MNSTNTCDINQQSNANNKTNTEYHDINISVQELNIIKNGFHIKNDKECNSVDENVKENEKVVNESIVYEHDTKSPLFTHIHSLTENTITTFQKFDKVCDNYHNINETDNLNMKEPLFSLDELDLVINDFEKSDNIYVLEERSFSYDNEVTEIDNLNLNSDSCNNINALSKVEISVENVAIKGEKVPDNLNMDNISLHISPINSREICVDYDDKSDIKVDLSATSNFNINENVSTTENKILPKDNYNLNISNRLHSYPNANRKISIDTNNTNSELKITTYINDINDNLSTTENITLPKHKEINKLRNVRKQKKNLTRINTNDNDLKIINGKKTELNTNIEIPNDCTKNNIFKGNIQNGNLNKNHLNVFKIANTKFEPSTNNVCGSKSNFKQSNNKICIPYIVILDSDDEGLNSSVRNDNLDTISISSDEELKEKCDPNIDSDSNGYNSSDFEFIDEDEAKTDILNYNHYNKVTKHYDEFKTIENLQNFIINDYFDTLISNNLDKNSNEEHTVPQGVDFINLFNENYAPLRRHCLEIKDVNAGIYMNVGHGAVGFDMRMYREDPEMEAFRQEANDSKKKILSLYQDENRRRRRRY